MLKKIPLVLLASLLFAANTARAADPGEDYVNGQKYFSGDGVPQNYARAAEFFRSAGEAGHPYALYSLALMHEHGYGVKKDMAEARRWYERAAKAGHSGAEGRIEILDDAAKSATAAGPMVAMPAEIRLIGVPEPEAEAPKPLTRAEAPKPSPVPAPKPAAEPAPAPVPPVAFYEPGQEATPTPRPRPVVKPVAKPAPITQPITKPTPQPKPAPQLVTKAPEARPSPPALPAVTPRPAPAPAVAPAPVQASEPEPEIPSQVVATASAAKPQAVTPAGELRLPKGLDPSIVMAINRYRAAMKNGAYGEALRYLTEARVAGEITALGMNETQSAEALARVAVLARDERLSLNYLRQASALGSIPAQTALDQLASGADLNALAQSFAAEILVN